MNEKKILAENLLDAFENNTIEAKIIFQKIFNTLFDCFEKNNQDPYSVAWVDCAANNHSIGRGIFISGKFSDDSRKNQFSG